MWFQLANVWVTISDTNRRNDLRLVESGTHPGIELLGAALPLSRHPDLH
jgi:hypothetical protein